MRIIQDNTDAYYVQAVDTDSHRPAWVKIWNPHEVPAHILLLAMADWLGPTPGAYNPSLNLTKKGLKQAY